MTTPRLAVIGDWHQASVVSACFADMGYLVRGVGADTGAIATLRKGEAPVFEPGLDAMLKRNLEAGRLSFTTDYAEALQDVDFAFICVDTPVLADDESDLEPIWRAVDCVAAQASRPIILCVSAQVPVGTCDEIQRRLRSNATQISVAYVPEFLRLGTAIQTFREADRFVIGADDPTVAARVAALYAPLGRPVVLTDIRSAEMSKHASNAFMAASISFINEIASLCDATGADVSEVAAILKLDRRIGPHAFLGAGLGYAGGTLGRDVRTLHNLGIRHGTETVLMDAITEVNLSRVPQVVEQLKRIYPSLQDHRFGILGLTYKAGTSTLRRSAALEIIDLLLAEGATVAAFDPLVRFEGLELPPFDVHPDVVAAAQGASALVLVSPWEGISETDFRACAHAMTAPVFLDTGNFLRPSDLEAAGFAYVGVGRAAGPGNP